MTRKTNRSARRGRSPCGAAAPPPPAAAQAPASQDRGPFTLEQASVELEHLRRFAGQFSISKMLLQTEITRISTERRAAARCVSPAARHSHSADPAGRVGRAALPLGGPETPSRAQSSDPRHATARLLNSALNEVRLASAAEVTFTETSSSSDEQEDVPSPRESETSETSTISEERIQEPSTSSPSHAEAAEKVQIKVRYGTIHDLMSNPLLFPAPPPPFKLTAGSLERLDLEDGTRWD